MRVLLINQYCGFGSTGKIVQNLHDIIIQNGGDCCIAYGRYHSENLKYNTYKIGGKLNNYGHVLETRLFDNHGFASRIATYKLVNFIKKYNPDVIHIHCLHGYYLNIEILFDYLKSAGKKIVWTFHDCWAFSPHGGYVDYDQDGKLPTEVKNKSELKEYPKAKWMLFNNYARKKIVFSGVPNMTVVTPSRWLSEMTKQTFFSEYEIRTIYNGIDLKAFYQEETEVIQKYGDIKNRKIILGVASVWDKRKGFRYMNQLADVLNPEEYTVVVIGKTEGDTVKSDNLKHIEQTSNIKEMRYWYSAASVFVNPTLEDNFPTTNLEALACGTPVITFNTGGSPEAITKETGIVVEKGNINKIIHAIGEINNIKAEDCISNASNFEKNKKFKEYLTIYSM